MVLIQAGSNVNSLNNNLYSSLHLAAANNRLEIAKVLLANKANALLKTKFDSTAEDLAKNEDNWGIVALLREHGSTKSVAPAQNNSSHFPARPAKRSGVISCNTRCNNGDCYRTYDDGRQVRFQAQRKYNPISSQWEFDSGSC